MRTFVGYSRTTEMAFFKVPMRRVQAVIQILEVFCAIALVNNTYAQLFSQKKVKPIKEKIFEKIFGGLKEIINLLGYIWKTETMENVYKCLKVGEDYFYSKPSLTGFF